MDVLLECDCGNQVRVSYPCADASVTCQCGQKLRVPAAAEIPPASSSIAAGYPPISSAAPPHGMIAADHLAGLLPAGAKPKQDYASLFYFADAQEQLGYSAEQIENQLVEQGVERSYAREIAQDAVQNRRDAVREAGLRNMFIGGTICVIGLGVTLVSYWLAVSYAGSGKFILASGAMVFGGVRFLYGLLQVCFRSN